VGQARILVPNTPAQFEQAVQFDMLLWR